MRAVLLDALEKQYEAEIAASDARIKLFLDHPVGISEHPNILKEIDRELTQVAEAEEKLNVLKDYVIPNEEKDAL
jgi:hypothetical protein